MEGFITVPIFIPASEKYSGTGEKTEYPEIVPG
jgi:hypothetical protein